MPLVSCRACGHQVDTSAMACPSCGATDPGKKISRQQRNLIIFLIQLVFWASVLGMGGRYVWTHWIPQLKQYFAKSQAAAPSSGAPDIPDRIGMPAAQ